VTVAGSPGCGATLATGIRIVARRSEVEGRLATASGSPTCGLVLRELKVKQGAGEHGAARDRGRDDDREHVEDRDDDGDHRGRG